MSLNTPQGFPPARGKLSGPSSKIENESKYPAGLSSGQRELIINNLSHTSYYKYKKSTWKSRILRGEFQASQIELIFIFSLRWQQSPWQVKYLKSAIYDLFYFRKYGVNFANIADFRTLTKNSPWLSGSYAGTNRPTFANGFESKPKVSICESWRHKKMGIK